MTQVFGLADERQYLLVEFMAFDTFDELVDRAVRFASFDSDDESTTIYTVVNGVELTVELLGDKSYRVAVNGNTVEIGEQGKEFSLSLTEEVNLSSAVKAVLASYYQIEVIK